MRHLASYCVAAALASFAVPGASAQENYESWEILQSTFPSTGGGGIVIKEYNPVIVGSKCVTNFTATEPSGKIYYNIVEFDAVPEQGGTLCTSGAWRGRGWERLGNDTATGLHQERCRPPIALKVS